MTPPYLNWSQERGFYYDPDGQYVRRSDAAVLLAKLDACTEAHALTAQRAEQAEQQLTAARLDAEEQLSLKNAHLVQANEVGRAQVLAQVTQAFKLHWEDGAQPQAFLDTLIHLQPDASMAVLSVADREQAIEVCICAAIRLKDGQIFRGHRHDSCFLTAMRVPGIGEDGIRESEQGFITSRNRYVDRIEGMRLQKAAGIESITGYRGDILFSEDLY